MPAENGINILLAGLLFLGSSLIVYMTWYMIQRRNKETPNTKGKEAQQEKRHKGEKWGVEKDAYCYPKINDIMGFEFVKVVKVDSEKTDPEPQPEPRPNWEESKGIGGLTAVSSNEMNQEREEDEPYPDPTAQRYTRPQRQQPQQENTENVEEEDITQLNDVREEDLLEGNNFEEWPDHDNNSLPSDEEFGQILNNSEGIIEPPEMNSEQITTAKEIEDLQRYVNDSEQTDYGPQVDNLMSDDDILEGDVDFAEDTDQYPVSEEDLPDIN